MSNATAVHGVWEATLKRFGIDQTGRNALYLLHDHSEDGRALANEIVHKLGRPNVKYDNVSKFVHKSVLNARDRLSWSSSLSWWSAASSADESPESWSWSADHWYADESHQVTYQSLSRWSPDPWYWYDDGENWCWTSEAWEEFDAAAEALEEAKAESWRVCGWTWEAGHGWSRAWWY